ncbi:hypothetical protein HYC85_016257 [Camellia sinensis]|uniref:Plastocyanin-like domain-containing protein n=1 Tax=Camellia sinensis TaxID=4442 RepID=A0A7J7GZ77_CAMSI|nr:hypothetical protein HYC85_016257 [Camellia sinensis]
MHSPSTFAEPGLRSSSQPYARAHNTEQQDTGWTKLIWESQYRLFVDYSKTYLLRLINAAVSSELFFAIADHNVTVVGMDGNYLEPISTSYLVISPGQTVNALLTANQPLGYYYMAIRQYVTNGYPDVYPPNTAIVENISGVYSADFPDFPLNYYNFTGDNLPNSTAIPTIATMVKMLNYNETVQVVFQESNVLRGAENHPMHMHGYSFYVVGSGPGNYDNVSDLKTFNLVDPLQVNTFRVPKNGWVAIRCMDVALSRDSSSYLGKNNRHRVRCDR